MKAITRSCFFPAVLLAVAWVTVSALGQGVTPGPEHEILRRLEGNWDAKILMEGNESTGASTYKVACGGLWVASEFHGDFGGTKFEGRGLDTYDAEKKKYVSVWVDSMSTKPMIFEGTYDKAKKTMTMTAEGPGFDGKPAKFKSVTQITDDDHQTFTMYLVGADGQETKMMTIRYTRKK